MANTHYISTIYALDVVPQTNENLNDVIVNVKWEYKAINGAYAAAMLCNAALDNVTNTENFITFNEVDHDTVLRWVHAKADMTALTEELDALLQNEMAKPTFEKVPPWEGVHDNNLFLFKFVVVQDGQVIWGPRQWDVYEINYTLQKNGVIVALPNTVAIIPNHEPLVVDERTTIYRVDETLMAPPNHRPDPNIYNYVPWNVSWDFSSGKAMCGLIKEIKPLDDLKVCIVEWYKTVMDQKVLELNVAGNFKIKEVHDMLKLLTFHLTDTTQWLNDDLELVVVDQAQIKDMIQVFVDKIKLRQTQMAATAQQIKNATTVEEVLAIYDNLQQSIVGQ